MNAVRAYALRAVLNGAQAVWWAFVAFILSQFLGAFGLLPLGLAGIALYGAIENAERSLEARGPKERMP